MTKLQQMIAETALQTMADKANCTKADIVAAIEAGAVNVVARFEEYVRLATTAILETHAAGELHPSWLA